METTISSTANLADAGRRVKAIEWGTRHFDTSLTFEGQDGRTAISSRYPGETLHLVASARDLHVHNTLHRITFKECALFASTAWRLTTSREGGCFIQLGFMRRDTHTGKEELGWSRKEWIAGDAPDDSILFTGLLLAKLIAEHETMEAFIVDGYRIVNPHRSIAGHQAGEDFDHNALRDALNGLDDSSPTKTPEPA